jgi:hypothetical protein
MVTDGVREDKRGNLKGRRNEFMAVGTGMAGPKRGKGEGSIRRDGQRIWLS